MDKFYKVTIGLSVLIVTLAAAYYLAAYLPESNNRQQLVQNQALCLELEQKVVEQFLNENLGLSEQIKSNTVSTENHFNITMNKCFVELSYLPPCSGGDCSNHTMLYDAAEFRLVASAEEHILFHHLGPDYYDSYDYSQTTTTTQITKDKFNELLEKYMTQ